MSDDPTTEGDAPADLPVPDGSQESQEALGPGGKRPAYALSAKKRKDYLALLREGGRRSKSARAINIDPSTIYRNMRDEQGHLTDFGKAMIEAEAEADDEVENALYDAAVSGNVPAIQTWLYNRKSDKWQPRTGAQAVAISGSVSSVTEVRLEVSAKEELMAVISRMGANLTVPTFSPFPAGTRDGEPAGPVLGPGQEDADG